MEKRLENIQCHQKMCEVYQQLTSYCEIVGKKEKLPHPVEVNSQSQGLLMRRNRIIIPQGTESRSIKQLYIRHQGIHTCLCGGKEYQKNWNNCIECCKMQVQRSQSSLAYAFLKEVNLNAIQVQEKT